MTRIRSLVLVSAAAALLTACAATGPSTRAAAKPDAALEAVLAGPQRSAEQRERDGERRPAASLAFWGLKPGAAILEVQPGGGWWTQILAPYAARTGGRYTATAADLWPDGSRLLVRTYESLDEFWLSSSGIADTHNTIRVPVPVGAEHQGESASYDPLLRGYWTISEGVNPTIWFSTCASEP